MSMLPARVRMFEVGPRDGLQNEPKAVPLPVKAELIERLANAGLKAIEAGSFVSPKWVPQMADTAELLALLPARPGVVYSVLTPNMTGLQRAIAAGAREVAIFGAATESFSRRNTNCSIEEGLARMGEVAAAAARAGIPVRGYLSCVLGCPYEGAVAAEIVAREAERLFALGCYELSLGDTIGVGTPAKAQTLIDTVAARIPRERLAVHFHDTYGQALANILACLERGVGTIDSSVAGLGGCPYAQGASGNVASEDVLYMLDGMGISTGIDFTALAAAGGYIAGALGRETGSKAARACAGRAA